MLFQALTLPDHSTKMCLFHTAEWPIRFKGNLNDPRVTCYFSKEKNSMVADEKSCYPCDVHNEYLIYLFYGRPAYRWNYFPPYPVLFVFSRDHAIRPYKIYPFDSGAFHGKFYDGAYSNDDLSQYLLFSKNKGVGIDDIPKLIDAIWGDKKNYYSGTVPNETLMNGQYADSLSDLDKEYLRFIYAGPGPDGNYGKADSRAFTIEVIVHKRLPLHDLEKIYFPNAVNAMDVIRMKQLFSQMSGHNVAAEVLPGDPAMSFEAIFKAGEYLI